MALGRANLGAQNEEDGQRGGNQKGERRESSWAWLYKYIYLEKSKLFFNGKPLTFCHPNCGSQKTLRELQNSDSRPRLGDSRQLSQSPQGNWRWTRKVKAKTVTVALSDQQSELFRRAIDDHRKLEKLIDQMRALSQQVLLNSVEGPARRKRRISS